MFNKKLSFFDFFQGINKKVPEPLDSGTWESYQIGLVLRSELVVVHGEVTETEIDELAFAAGGRVAVHEADVHAAAVVGGATVVVGFGVASIERPDRTTLAVREADGVAGKGGFGRSLAGLGTIIAGVVPDVTHDEVAEDALTERKAGELILHVGADDTDGVGGVVVAVFMGRAEVGLLVQTAFIDDQHIVGFALAAG